MSFRSATADLPMLSSKEVKLLLKATGETKGAEREHMMYSAALGTGLRESELVALNVGDVLFEGKLRSKILLTVYKGSSIRVERPLARGRPPRVPKRNKRHVRQVVHLPKRLRLKLVWFLKWKKDNGQSLKPSAPLFVTTKDSGSSFAGDRMSTRLVRHHFRVWQTRCKFEELRGFHSLRHTALSQIYRRTKDIRAVQKAARHANLNTTEIYTHLTEEELANALEGLEC